MARKSKKSTASTLDIRTPKEIPMFEKLLSKGPMAMVLVYADWCGHCTQFKEKVWNDSTLSKTKNVNTAAVHYDMLDKTSLKNTPVNGYPSMFLVGKDKEAKEIPTPQNTEELLKFDTSSANAMNTAITNTNNNSPNANSSDVEVNTDVENTNTNEYSPSNNTPLSNNSYTPGPPDALEDVANTPETNETERQMGGSLFDILSRYNTQQGGRARRSKHKTAKRKNRRALTRKRK